MKKETGTSPKFKTQEPTDSKPALMELFTDSIRDIYWAENHLVKNLPKMINSATSTKLSGAIQDHLEQTKTHVARLEQIFDLLGEKIIAKKCDAMEGLTKEGEGIIEETEEGTSTRDIGIIMASQKVEHYEIATYTGLAKLANTLGLTDVAELLMQTLDEELETDELLGTIAEEISIDAAAE